MDSEMMECTHAKLLAQSPFVLGDVVLKVLMSSMGLVLCVILFFRESELRKLVHANARLIIIVHFLAVMINALAQTVAGVVDFLRFTVLRSSGTSCAIPLLSHNYAIFINIPIILSQNMDSLTLVALGVERTVATVMAKSYEKKKRRFVSFSLLAVSGVISAWWLVNFIEKVNAKEEELYSMITVPSEVSGDSRLNVLVLAVLELVIFVLFLVLLAFNLNLRNKAKRVSAPLGLKYQVEENLTSVTVLLPMATVQVLVYSVTFVLTYGLGTTHNMETDNESSLLFTNVSPLYHIALPIIWFVQARQKRRKITRKVQSRLDSLAQNETKKHFEMLKDIFHDSTKRTRF